MLKTCTAHAEQLPPEVVATLLEGFLTEPSDYSSSFADLLLDLPAAGAIPLERKLQLLVCGLYNCNPEDCLPFDIFNWVGELPLEMARQLIPCIYQGVIPDGCLWHRQCGPCNDCELIREIAGHSQFGELSVQDNLELLEKARGHGGAEVTALVEAVVEEQHSEEEELLLLRAVLKAYRYSYAGHGDGEPALKELLQKPAMQQLPSDVLEQLLVGLMGAERYEEWETDAEVEAFNCLLSELPVAQELQVDSYLRLVDAACKDYTGEEDSPWIDALIAAKLPAADHVSSQQVVERVLGAAAAGAPGVGGQLLAMLLQRPQDLELPLLQQLAPVVVGFWCWGSRKFAISAGSGGEEEEMGPKGDAVALECCVCRLVSSCSQLPATVVTSMFIAAAAGGRGAAIPAAEGAESAAAAAAAVAAAAAAAAAVQQAGSEGPSMQHQQQGMRHLKGFRALDAAIQARLGQKAYMEVVYEVLLGLVGAVQLPVSSRKLWLQQLMRPGGVLKGAGGLNQEQQLQLLMAALENVFV